MTDMAGLWSIQDTVIIESNNPVPTPPVDGTIFELDPTRIVTIGGFDVSPGALAQAAGAPLISYINVVDMSSVFYGVVIDERASGGSRFETALAGGAVDADTVVVEALNSSQSAIAAFPSFTRSRYKLVRTSGTMPLQHRPEEWTFEDMARSAFGGF